MRKFVIHTRVAQEDGTVTEPVLLEPFVHGTLYNIPEIRAARQILADNEHFEMIAIRLDNRCYMLTVVTKDQMELYPNAFELVEKTSEMVEKASD